MSYISGILTKNVTPLSLVLLDVYHWQVGGLAVSSFLKVLVL